MFESPTQHILLSFVKNFKFYEKQIYFTAKRLANRPSGIGFPSLVISPTVRTASYSFGCGSKLKLRTSRCAYRRGFYRQLPLVHPSYRWHPCAPRQFVHHSSAVRKYHLLCSCLSIEQFQLPKCSGCIDCKPYAVGIALCSGSQRNLRIFGYHYGFGFYGQLFLVCWTFGRPHFGHRKLLYHSSYPNHHLLCGSI